MTKSRRLKHFKETNEFYVKTPARPDLEFLVLDNVRDYVMLSHKYLLKGQTLETDIKKVDGQVQIDSLKNQYKIKLHLHVHHYSACYFDLNPYLGKLAAVLKLEPNSISTVKPPQNRNQISTAPEKAHEPTSAFSA